MILFVTRTYRYKENDDYNGLACFYKYLSLPFEGPYSLRVLNDILEDYAKAEINKKFWKWSLGALCISSWKEYNPDGIIVAEDDEIMEISKGEYMYYKLPKDERYKINKADYITGVQAADRMFNND